MAETARPDTGAGGTSVISRRGASKPHSSRAGLARSGDMDGRGGVASPAPSGRAFAGGTRIHTRIAPNIPARPGERPPPAAGLTHMHPMEPDTGRVI